MSAHIIMMAVFTWGAITLHAMEKNKGSIACVIFAILTLLVSI